MKKWFFWLFPLAWMGLIFYASSQPYQEQNLKPVLQGYMDLSFLLPYLDWISFSYHGSEVSADQLGVEGFIEFFIRKGAHVGAYMVLFLLLFIAIRKTASLSLFSSSCLSFFLAFLYAVSDEFHQSITPDRTPYAGDVILDCVGAGIGMGFVYMAYCLGLLYKQKGKR